MRRVAAAACLAISLAGTSAQDAGATPTRLLTGLQHHMLHGIRMHLVEVEPTSRGATLDLFKFSRSDNPEHLIGDEFIPEAMVKLSGAECEASSVTSTSTSTSSTEMLTSVAEERSIGFERTTEVTVAVPKIPISASTEISFGVGFASEEAITDFNRETSFELKKSTRHSARRIVYGVQWRLDRPNLGDLHEGFVSDVQSLEEEWSDSKADRLIEGFGTHFYDAVEFGGSVSASMYFDESATEFEIQQTTNEVSSIGVDFFGASFGSGSVSSEDLTEFGSKYVSFERSALRVVSDVDPDNFCTSEIEQPEPLSYTLRPVWDLMGLAGASNITVERFSVYATRRIIHNLVLADESTIPSCTWRGCIDGTCTGNGCVSSDGNDGQVLPIRDANDASGIRIVNQPAFSSAGVHAVEVSTNRLGADGRVSIYPAGFAQTRYVYMDTPMKQFDAEAACVQIGGHLPSIHSAAENSALVNFVDERRRELDESLTWEVRVKLTTSTGDCFNCGDPDMYIKVKGRRHSCPKNTKSCTLDFTMFRRDFSGAAENCVTIAVYEEDTGLGQKDDSLGSKSVCFGQTRSTGKDNTKITLTYRDEAHPVWIGLSRDADAFSWLDGTDDDYTNWLTSSSVGGAYINVVNGNTKWQTQSATAELPFVCQFGESEYFQPTSQSEPFEAEGTSKVMYYFDYVLAPGVYDVRIYEAGAEEANSPPTTNRLFEVFEDPALFVETPEYGYHSLDDVLKVTYSAPIFDMSGCTVAAVVPNGTIDDWDVLKEFATPNVFDASFSANVSAYVLLGGGQECGGDGQQIVNNNPAELSQIFLPVGDYEARLYLGLSDVQESLRAASINDSSLDAVRPFTMVARQAFQVEPPSPIPAPSTPSTSGQAHDATVTTVTRAFLAMMVAAALGTAQG